MTIGNLILLPNDSKKGIYFLIFTCGCMLDYTKIDFWVEVEQGEIWALRLMVKTGQELYIKLC